MRKTPRDKVDFLLGSALIAILATIVLLISMAKANH